MKWRVEGVNMDTGDEVSVEVDAPGMVEAAAWARQQRIALKPHSPVPVREALPPPTEPKPTAERELSYTERRKAAKRPRRPVEEPNRPGAWARFAGGSDPMARSVAKGVFFGMWAWTLSLMLVSIVLWVVMLVLLAAAVRR